MKEWEEMLDKMLIDYADNVCSSGDPKRTLGTNEVTIKQFISNLLAKEKMELVERIKSLKNIFDNKDGGSVARYVYQMALDDVISALNKEEKEEVGEE